MMRAGSDRVAPTLYCSMRRTGAIPLKHLELTQECQRVAQKPKAAPTEAPWASGGPLLAAAPDSVLQAFLQAHAPGADTPMNREDLVDTVKKNRRCAATLREATLALAAMALLRRLSAVHLGTLPAEQFTPEATSAAKAAASAAQGAAESSDDTDQGKKAKSAKKSTFAGCGDAGGGWKGGIGYAGDAARDATDLAKGLSSKEAGRQRALEELRLCAAALNKLINAASFTDCGLPVRFWSSLCVCSLFMASQLAVLYVASMCSIGLGCFTSVRYSLFCFISFEYVCAAVHLSRTKAVCVCSRCCQRRSRCSPRAAWRTRCTHC